MVSNGFKIGVTKVAYVLKLQGGLLVLAVLDVLPLVHVPLGLEEPKCRVVAGAGSQACALVVCEHEAVLASARRLPVLVAWCGWLATHYECVRKVFRPSLVITQQATRIYVCI